MSTNPPDYPEGHFGTIVATAFYGITCMQVFSYYTHYGKDPLHMKIFVAAIWALNTLHEALALSGSYKYYAAAFANPSSPMNCNPELILQTLATALAAILAQGYLMHRIYVLVSSPPLQFLFVAALVSGIKIITLLSWLVLSVLQLVSTIIYVSKALYTNSSNFDVKVIAISLTLSVGISAGEDVLIAIFMVYLLVRQRSWIGVNAPDSHLPFRFASTTRLLPRLIIFAVNTGTWTALFALLTIIFLYVLPSKMLYSAFGTPICSVYCNTTLANLNARSYLKNHSESQRMILDFDLGAIPGSDGRRGEGAAFTPPEGIQGSTELAPFSDGIRSMISADAGIDMVSEIATRTVDPPV